MDGHSDVERWKAPTWQRGDVRFMPRHEYERNALELDRNYHVTEGGNDFVALRLDFPGEGLSNDPAMMQLMQEMHFASVMRYGSHPVLYP
ncbi:MAG: hypothetical protein WAL80_04170 [Xanthobacteraceae bacterium]|jgi:hypothetical protein